MIFAAGPYVHGHQYSANDCQTVEVVKVPNKEEIERLSKELQKYGKLIVSEHCCEPITEIHLIVKVPYVYKVVGEDDK